MTIASRTTAVTLLGNGSNRKFTFTFRAWEGEIRVVITSPDNKATDVTTESTIVLASNNLGGSVTYPAASTSPALATGWKITILRDMDFLQPVRLVNVTRYDPVVIEQEFDRLTAMCQQLKEQAERAISVAEGASISAQELLNDIDRAARLVDPASLASGVFNVRKAQVLTAGAAGRTINLLGYYYPTRDVLYLSWNGVVLTPIKPGVEPTGDYQYEEVGTDPNVESNKVKLHFATQAGDVLDMFVVASAAGRNIEKIEQLVATAGASAQAAKVSETAAAQSAEDAQVAADTLPDISTASAGDALVAEVGPGGAMVARWQPPSAGAPQRVDIELTAPLAAGTAFTVPQYTVGGKKLTVYLDGVLCDAGAAGLYLETGAVGSKSTTITLNDTLKVGWKVTAIVAG